MIIIVTIPLRLIGSYVVAGLVGAAVAASASRIVGRKRSSAQS
ncbi:hypothetical protein WNB94_07765 [Aquabacterium sp. A3]